MSTRSAKPQNLLKSLSWRTVPLSGPDSNTYIILDSSVFFAKMKAVPYPVRIDDFTSAIFYSTWMQAIASTVRHTRSLLSSTIMYTYGALAPIYLLQKVLPVCLLLQKAEFQRLWPLRTKEEMKEGSLLGVQYQQGAGSPARSMFSSVTYSVCSTPWHYS